MASRRPRPEQPVFVLTLRGEGPDVIHRLRRGLKYLGRVCRLRAVDVRQISDQPDDSAGTPNGVALDRIAGGNDVD